MRCRIQARIARELVSFRHPRISAIKLAVADPNADLLRGDMTADEMREIIRRKLVDEGLLPPTEIDHQELVRDGDEQRPRGRYEGLLVDAADALQVAFWAPQ